MTDTINPLGLKHDSHFERTGKLGPKIDVYFVADAKAPSRSLVYKHSTQWHRTCKEAIASASRHYGLPIDCLRAHKAEG